MLTPQRSHLTGITAPSRGGLRFAAEMHCMHCARLVGTWEWEQSAPQGVGSLKAPDGSLRTDLLWRVRCPACGGPVYLDEAMEVREQEAVIWGPEKRGRKPKQRAA